MHVADDDLATRGLVDQGHLSSMMCGRTVSMWVRDHIVGCHMLLQHQNKFKCTPQLSTRRLAFATCHNHSQASPYPSSQCSRDHPDETPTHSLAHTHHLHTCTQYTDKDTQTNTHTHTHVVYTHMSYTHTPHPTKRRTTKTTIRSTQSLANMAKLCVPTTEFHVPLLLKICRAFSAQWALTSWSKSTLKPIFAIDVIFSCKSLSKAS